MRLGHLFYLDSLPDLTFSEFTAGAAFVFGLIALGISIATNRRSSRAEKASKTAEVVVLPLEYEDREKDRVYEVRVRNVAAVAVARKIDVTIFHEERGQDVGQVAWDETQHEFLLDPKEERVVHIEVGRSLVSAPMHYRIRWSDGLGDHDVPGPPCKQGGWTPDEGLRIY